MSGITYKLHMFGINFIELPTAIYAATLNFYLC